MGKRVKIWSRVERVVALCVGLGIVLAGCAGQKPETGTRKPEQTEVKIPSPEDFTTLGKPTKTVWTPWGERKIYDPIQDPEIIAIFEKWYSENNKTYTQYREENSPEYQALQIAEKIHVLDYMRLGCEFRERTFAYGDNWYYRKKLISNCNVEQSLGTAELSICELDGLKDRYLGRIDGEGDRYPFGRVPATEQEIKQNQRKRGVVGNKFIGFSSYPSSAEQIDVIFDVNCRKWNGIRTTYLGFENFAANYDKKTGHHYTSDRKQPINRFRTLVDPWPGWPGEPTIEEFCQSNPKQQKENPLCP